jgi:outer membrane protein OmpA-like peptidoglycan-associated protein
MAQHDSPDRLATQESDAADYDTGAAPWRAISPTLRDDWKATLRPSLNPVACWRTHHGNFRFDSSVVLPEIFEDLKSLKPLIGADRVASIFGHADPVGDLDYNAHLSARRARALFALLTRNPDIWDHLFCDPHPESSMRRG